MSRSTSLTPEERTLRARIGAQALHAKHDAKVTTAKARETFLQRFELEVDPDGLLDPAERATRAEHAKRSYFLNLAYLSARARKKAS